MTGKESGGVGYCDVEGFSVGIFRNGRQGSIACVAGLKNEHIGRCPQLLGIGWRHVVHLADDRASASTAASSEDDVAVSDVDGLVVVGVGVDEKFAPGERRQCRRCFARLRQWLLQWQADQTGHRWDGAISCDVEYVAMDIWNGFAKVVIARVGKVG